MSRRIEDGPGKARHPDSANRRLNGRSFGEQDFAPVGRPDKVCKNGRRANGSLTGSIRIYHQHSWRPSTSAIRTRHERDAIAGRREAHMTQDSTRSREELPYDFSTLG